MMDNIRQPLFIPMTGCGNWGWQRGADAFR